MVKLTIDNRPVEAPVGTTILEAAAKVGIRIPTLCHLAGREPATSCFVCVVQIEGRRELSPACATRVVAGMVVQTQSEDVRRARQTALELLLSDHAGDCVGPCTLGCPAHLEIADFIAAERGGDVRGAAAIVLRALALPATLGCICPGFCEGACRRKSLDEAVAIRELHRFAAETDLALPTPYDPPCAAATGWRAAVVGAGPAGLAAALHLRQFGHECTVFEARDELGGALRTGVPEARLPRTILDGEIDRLRRLGVKFQAGAQLGGNLSLEGLRADYGAVLLALGTQSCGGPADPRAEHVGRTETTMDFTLLKALGLETGPRGLKVERNTMATNLPGIFAAGNVVGGAQYAVHAVAGGRRAAVAMDAHLRGQAPGHRPHEVHSLMGHLGESEVARLRAFADPARRVVATGAGGAGEAGPRLTVEQAAVEARRCLDCDCRKRDNCGLRTLAEEYGAATARFRGERREFERDATHRDVIYEAGKCIQCGICLRLAEEAGEPLGLAFIGRGFRVRMAAPFSASLAEALHETARRAAEACPTGALAVRRGGRDGA
jgi:NADPH-dependent glutamate synthase beta subunit-like oxidoreductase/ferredoxin